MRQLLALPPVVGGENFAAASDTYSLTITPTSGATIPAATSLTSVAWGVSVAGTFTGSGSTAAVMEQFRISLPSGPASPTFLRWLSTGTVLSQVKIESKTAAGVVRASWLLEPSSVQSFVQSPGPNGMPQDEVKFYVSKITQTFRRLDSAGNSNEDALVGFDRATGLGTNTGLAAQTYDSDFLATAPNIAETMEFGGGQLPAANSTISFTNSGVPGGTGKAFALGLTFDAVDGRESIALFGRAVTNRHFQGAVHTRRDPTTGAALQRYRFGDVVVSRYGFSDTVLDNNPRQASIGVEAAKYNLFNYTYPAPEVQAATSYGWDFVRNVAWSPAGFSAHVPAPTSGAVSSPVPSVAFYFQSPIALTLASFSFEGFSTAGLVLTPSNGNMTWTISNLSPQQSADGHYAVKLLAYKFNPNSSGDTNILIGSAGRSWDLDRSGPILVGSSFDYDAAPPTPYEFDFKLSEPITASATDGTAPILIRRVDIGALVTTATAHVASDGVTLTANLGNTLADARYRATLPAGSVRDAAGNLLATDLNLPFFVLAGDANHDATVNFDDLVILSQNYNRSGKSFATGNFDYDAAGKVDFNDLVILSQRYGKTLSPLPLIAPVTKESAAGTKRDRTIDTVL